MVGKKKWPKKWQKWQKKLPKSDKSDKKSDQKVKGNPWNFYLANNLAQ